MTSDSKNPKQSSTNRLETYIGDTGAELGEQPSTGRLKLYSGRYRFMDRTWGIHVWAADQSDAEDYCKQHGMTYDGQILEIGEL